MSMNVSRVGANIPLPKIGDVSRATDAGGDSFQKVLSDAVSTIDQAQAEADSSVAKLAAGEQVELHEVMLATEKASMALQLTVQVRNKIVEAYQDIMRMQV